MNGVVRVINAWSFSQNPEGSVQVEDGQNKALEFCKQEKFDYNLPVKKTH